MNDTKITLLFIGHTLQLFMVHFCNSNEVGSLMLNYIVYLLVLLLLLL